MNKMEKMIKKVLENLEDIKENQKRLEEEVKEIRPTMNIFANQQTPPQKKPEENNTKSIMEYLEKNYNYLRNIGETQTKEKAYGIKILNVGKPVKPTKNSLL